MEYKSENKDFKIEQIRYNKFSFECENGHRFNKIVKDYDLSKVYCQRCLNYNKRFEKLKLLYKENGYELISISNKKAIVKCENGHTFERDKITLINNKKACLVCYSKENILNNHIKFQKENGINIVSIDNKIIKCECKNGHHFDRLLPLRNGYVLKCKICNDKYNIINKYEELFKKNKLEIINKKNVLFTVKCENGHVFNTYIRSLKGYKNGCPKCNQPQLSLEEKIEILKKIQLEYISNDYNKFTVKCKNGHILTRNFHNFKNKEYNCKECRNKKYIYNMISSKLKLNNIEIINIENKLITCKCGNGHIFIKNIDSLISSKYKCNEC